MKSKFILSILLIILLSAFSKAQDDIQQLSPSLKTTDREPVILETYNVKVNVMGNLATTTCEMFFYNNANRVLEGELTFPLGKDQSVSRFAMDVNGKLREGVPVEKNKGQQVFESVERKQIDPGLLEKVQGNIFRTKVYPIPAKGYKHIVIAYQQELENTIKGKKYTLPLYLERNIKKFSLKVEVLKQYIEPVIEESELINFSFERWNEQYVAEAEYNNIKLDHQLSFIIPKVREKYPVYIEKGKITEDYYFYFEIEPEIKKRPKKMPQYLAVYWDVSASGIKREVEKELEFLDDYFSKIKVAQIDLILFANDIVDKTGYKLVDGKCSSLLEKLKSLKYDGGTQFGILDLCHTNADEIILFTDGMGTFGKQEIQNFKKPIIVVSSAPQADYSFLEFIASASGGVYINLAENTPKSAFEVATTESFQFISANSGDGVSDICPSIPVPVNTSFFCTGKLNTEKSYVTLNFGYGNEITYSKRVEIRKENLTESGMVEKVWAQKKIKELDLQYEKNKDKINDLGKKFSIVTRNTSLIVLETVQDYIQYEIIPPEELQNEYYRLLKEQKKVNEKQESENLENAVRLYQEKINWWNTDYPLPVAKRKDHYQVPPPPLIPDREYSSETKTITGNVIDAETQEVLPGVNIIVRGTSTGTITDVNGDFRLVLPVNAVIRVSFIGYRSEDIDVTNINNLTINLSLEIQSLEEVVVAEDNLDMEVSSMERSETVYFMMSAPSVASEDITGTGSELEKKTGQENKGAIFLKPWDTGSPYLAIFEQIPVKDFYVKYLEIKEEYKDMPSFYVDVSEMFYNKGLLKDAVRIISNLAEIQLQNHELLRVLAHRLEQMKEYKAAIEIYKEIKEIRAEEPQSYRDLALALSIDNQYQEAIDILYDMLKKSWDSRFHEIEAIIATEMNAIIAVANDEVNTEQIDRRLLKNLPVDIRVVLNWDADNTDMDLWVTDPGNEKCFYSHKLTYIGGRMSNDFTGGYGPEEFMLKKASNGKYMIEANYFGSNQQRVAGPVTIYLQLFTDYGKPNQELKEITLRLKENKEVVKIGEFIFE